MAKIESLKPVQEPARDAITYPDLWITWFQGRFPDPNADGQLLLTLKHYRTDPDTGLNEFAPRDDGIMITIENMLAQSAKRPALAQALAALQAVIGEELVQLKAAEEAAAAAAAEAAVVEAAAAQKRAEAARAIADAAEAAADAAEAAVEPK